ncbi:MAG: cell division protein FtsI, partial [Brachybacterium sp.]|nr:cell division protein FtsI [Brachybacterium sp.]
MPPATAGARRRGPLLVLVSALAIAVLVIAGLQWRDRFGSGEQEAEELAVALSAGEAPDQAGHDRILGPLLEAGAVPQVSLADSGDARDGTRTATLAWTWTLPDEAGTWEYTTQATLRRGEDGWTAELDPAAYAPDLTASEHLELTTLDPTLGSITDRDGTVLFSELPVTTLGLDKTQLAEGELDSAARDLAGLLGIDADRYAQSVTEHGPEAFVAALTIREEAAGDYPLDEAAQVSGYLAVDGTRPLAIQRDYAPGVLGSLREASAEDIEDSDGELEAGDLVAGGGVIGAARDEVLGTAGLEVVAVETDTDAERSLHRIEPVDGSAVPTTLDDDVQRLATAAIADEDSPSAVIVLQPSSGDVLATALGPTGQSYPVGLVGRYAPGSTFKTVTALSLLRAGLTPDTELECPETAVVAGRSFKNADSMNPSLFGTMPLRSAIAHSCNTAMLLQHETVDQPALADAATTLGIGQDAPTGLDAFMGSVDPEDTGAEHAAAMMGQGRVLASPLSMAVVLASVQNGATVAPRILADQQP